MRLTVYFYLFQKFCCCQILLNCALIYMPKICCTRIEIDNRQILKNLANMYVYKLYCKCLFQIIFCCLIIVAGKKVEFT